MACHLKMLVTITDTAFESFTLNINMQRINEAFE
jgi:hypothetical protein